MRLLVDGAAARGNHDFRGKRPCDDELIRRARSFSCRCAHGSLRSAAG